jgi:uncharacterized protein YjdB
MRKWYVALALLPFAVGCKSSPTNPSVAAAAKIVSISVALEVNSAVIGSACAASALAIDQNGNPVSLNGVTTWSSSAPAVASVDLSHNDKASVHPLSVGQAEIVCSVSDKTGQATLTVKDPIDIFELSPKTKTLRVGEEQVLTPIALGPDGKQIPSGDLPPATWVSSDSAIASVNDRGTVKAVAVGTATITATLAGHPATAVITVTL